MIRFIHEKHKEEFWKMHEKLQNIVMDIAVFVEEKFGKNIIPTSIYRPYKGDKHSVHNVWRGFDFRSRIFTKEEIDEIVKYVNNKYIYDPLRPHYKVAIYHNVGKGWHFHIQVHPRTERRKNNGRQRNIKFT